ncbi:MAG: hypothetical protein GF308_06980 [Candidatus Heimdallarchaeota archaeon]|nr:hypothetical protein [Candidatus Heimdallarchaeota archaeon]
MLTINWRTDPQLFEPEPVGKTSWLNANELITGGRKKDLFLRDNQILNLFPILVRRSDFVRRTSRDRILARFPFLVLTSDQKAFLKKKKLLLAEATAHYFYSSVNRSILQWRDRIQTFLERGALPFPVMRVAQEVWGTNKEFLFAQNKRAVSFTSARGEPFKIPTKLTKELAYLAGMVNGDGNLQRYILSIVDFSLGNIEQLQRQFQCLFAQEGRIQYPTKNSFELIITNKWLVRFFSFMTDQPIDKKKYPHLQEPLLFKTEPLRTYYWSGVLDADGSYANKNITFTSTSRRFAEDFLQYLHDKGIQATWRSQQDQTFRIYIPRKFHAKYKSFAKCFHPVKRREFQAITKGRSIEARYFSGFNYKALINGFFNFRLLKGLSVIGLAPYVKQIRRKRSKKTFAKLLRVTATSIRELETGRYGLNLQLLERMLKLEKQSLMPFLAGYQEPLKFRMRSSQPVRLDFRPNKSLKKIFSSLIFFENRIRLPSDDEELKIAVERHFGVQIKKAMIINKVIRDFVTAFCNFSRKKEKKKS